MSVTDNLYFIVMERPEYPGHISPGQIGFISIFRHKTIYSRSKCPPKLPLYIIGSYSRLDYEIEVEKLDIVSLQEAEMLLAVVEDALRLKWFKDKKRLETALQLTVDSEVTVEEKGEELSGIIRYIGRVKELTHEFILRGTLFGIELQGKDKGKGTSNGKYEYKTCFTCEKNCAVFVPFYKVKPVVSRSVSPPLTKVPDPKASASVVPLTKVPDPKASASVVPVTKAPAPKAPAPKAPAPKAPAPKAPALKAPAPKASMTKTQTKAPAPQPEPDPKPEPESDELHPGDRVTYFTDEKILYGMVVHLWESEGDFTVKISTDTEGEVEVPLGSVAKGEVPTEPEEMDVDLPPVNPQTLDLLGDLTINSMVEVTLHGGNSYGIIRWIGYLEFKGREELMVGLELEEEKGVCDGTFKDNRIFKCPPKKGLFVRPSSVRPDSRFHSPRANHSESKAEEIDMEVLLDEVDCSGADRMETVPPITSDQVGQLLLGRMKGIQGHCNSCYMDAALFSLFSCSSVLDSMLFKSTTPQDAPIQRTLLYDIVNPLRTKGFVEGRHIMKLRQQLQRHGYSHSFTTDEKDPEEFLTVIMHHILALDPLLKLSAGGKVQESYCYQIFLDQNHSLVLPTVQQLLEHSFHSAGLKLAEVPPCLILQMPRFGKKFKMFDKIIPSLEVDVTDFLSEGPQQCVMCGGLARRECYDCFKDPTFSPTGFKVFCEKCSLQVHTHPRRRSHQTSALTIPKDVEDLGLTHALTRDKLELFAVLCIETSHYVSFIKHGPGSEDWIFFDSMADRQGEIDGYNIPQVQACPEVGVYLEMSPADLANQVPRDMKGVAKRLFCDAYMYLYQSSSMSLYR